MEKQTQKPKLPQTPDGSYEWLKIQKHAYVSGVVGFPIKVEVLSFDFEEQTAYVRTMYQSGVLSFKKLFQFEKEADIL